MSKAVKPHTVEKMIKADVQSFAATIRAAILASGKSQSALASESGVKQPRISTFLAGGPINLRNAERLCAVLGLELRAADERRKRTKRANSAAGVN